MRPILALPALVLSLIPLPAGAQTTPPGQPLTEQQALTRLLTVKPVQAAWFDSAFLAQVPLAQIQNIVDQYTGHWGKLVRIEGSGHEYTVFMAQASFPSKVYLNAQGQFAGLWFGLAEAVHPVSLDDSMKAFGALPGKLAVLVLDDDKTRASLNPDEALGVGSAFKLAVLNALNDEIKVGKRHWSDVVPLNPKWKTLPSGVIRTWPDNTPMTLATYANEMISISDNTAADALLAIAGRAQVEAVSPRNTPFLSTREAFILKDPANAAKFHVDPRRIVVIGHSMGGFMTIAALAQHPEIAAGVVITEGSPEHDGPGYFGADSDPADYAPLAGTSPAALEQDAKAHAAAWSFAALAAKINPRPMLVLSANDGLRASNEALTAALKQAGSPVTYIHMDTDHGFTDHRIALESAVLDWVDKTVP